MFRHLLILLCLLCVAIPVSSFVDTQIEHLSRGGSGACISFSSGNQLYSTIGHSVGGHMRSVLDAGRKGGAIGPEIFATSGALNAGKELRAGLDPNYPNPLNPATSVIYSVKEQSHVMLKIYNVKGELVRTLVDEMVEAGEHGITWDGTNSRGATVTSGIYFLRLETKWGLYSRKMIVTK